MDSISYILIQIGYISWSVEDRKTTEKRKPKKNKIIS